MDDSHAQAERVPETAFRLEDLEFIDPVDDPRRIPTPDQLPAAVNRRHIPVELQRSATVEALLAQNEDLMARLAVNLRRLTHLESENEHLKSENINLVEINRALATQSNVWIEKETQWRREIQERENQLRELEGKAAQLPPLQDRLERYRKYQERIKSQVKPFVQQLKGYAESLAAEVQSLYAELAQRDQEITGLKVARSRQDEEIQEQAHRSADQQARLLAEFEKEKDLLLARIKPLEIRCAQLEQIQVDYDKMRVREAELENVVISLQRDLEEKGKKAASKERTLQEEIGRVRGQVGFLEAQVQDLTERLKGAETEKDRLYHQSHQLEEQLTGLRFIWSQQNEELEKLSAKLWALERLNAELSRKLNQARQEPSSSPPPAEAR